MKAGTNLFGYASQNPLFFTDRLGLVSWKCDYRVATVNQPIAGAGGGALIAGCVSECACGRRLAVVVAAGMAGGSVGPLPGGFSFSSITIKDPFQCPSADSLAGPISYLSGGVSLPYLNVTRLQLGMARGISPNGSFGVDIGLDVYGGHGGVVYQQQLCCGAK